MCSPFTHLCSATHLCMQHSSSKTIIPCCALYRCCRGHQNIGRSPTKSCSLSIATPLNVVMPSHHVLTILRTCYATNLYVQRSLSISTAPTCHTVISTSCVTAAHSLLCVSTATDRLFVCSCWRVLDLLVSRNSFTIHTTSPFLPVRRELVRCPMLTCTALLHF